MIQEFKGRTRKEIYEAKKIFYESDDSTKQTFTILLIALVHI